MRRRAESTLPTSPRTNFSGFGQPKSAADTQRLLHELQVHQIELEMQNAELRQTREELEVALEDFSDLYDFAPAGYFNLKADGTIQQVNLFGAKLAGVERSRLAGQSFGRLVAIGQRPVFEAFLKQVFASSTERSMDIEFLKRREPRQVVRVRAQCSPSGLDCRVVVVDITELKREEDKVRVSEIRYRRLFETAHDGVLLLDPATRKITDANPFMTQLLGYSHTQLVGKELFEIGLLQDESASQEMFLKLKRDREVRYENLPLENKSGRHQEVEVVANLYQENGHAVIQCNIRDITARKHTERELSEKARLLDLSHDAIIVRDMKGRIRYWNHGAEELYGWSRAEVMGKISNRLLHTKFPIPLKRMTEELHRTNRWIGELLHTRRNGQRITVLARKTLDRDRAGHPVAVLENITNITKRKEAEEKLRRSEALFALLLAQAPVGMYLVDAQFRLQQVNPTAQIIFKKIQPLLGRGFSEIVHLLWPGLVANKILAHFRHTLKTGEPYQSPEFAERRRDTGVQEVYEWQIQRVTMPAGEFGVVCFFSNITERKRAEETQRRFEVLTASNKKLESEIIRRQAVEESLHQSEQLQTRLLAEARQHQVELRELSREVLRAQEEERKRISRELHDVIAQTLTGINLRLASLKKTAGRNTADFERSVTRTQEIVSKSVDIVHEFARELRPAVLDDLGLIPALHTFVKRFSNRTRVHVHFTAFAGVEALDTAKRTVLFRVAQEALTNVSRHAKASRVEISLQKLAASIGMSIRDNGISFSVEKQLHAKGGKRLGLLGMRERVEMVGGTFCLESAPGQGTTIQVEIPFAKSPPPPTEKIIKETPIK